MVFFVNRGLDPPFYAYYLRRAQLAFCHFWDSPARIRHELFRETFPFQPRDLFPTEFFGVNQMRAIMEQEPSASQLALSEAPTPNSEARVRTLESLAKMIRDDASKDSVRYLLRSDTSHDGE